MKRESITISSRKVIYNIPLSEIVNMQSKGMSTLFHTATGDMYKCCKNIGAVLKELNAEKIFFRPHNSHAINIAQVKMYKKENGGRIIMTNGSEVPVYKRRKSVFLKRYNGSK